MLVVSKVWTWLLPAYTTVTLGEVGDTRKLATTSHCKFDALALPDDSLARNSRAARVSGENGENRTTTFAMRDKGMKLMFQAV